MAGYKRLSKSSQITSNSTFGYYRKIFEDHDHELLLLYIYITLYQKTWSSLNPY